MIIEERVERSQYVKLITWIVSFIILMAGIVFPVLILWVNQDMMSKVIGASVLCLIFFTLIFTVAYQPRKLILSETHIIMERILGQVYISYSDITDISLYHCNLQIFLCLFLEKLNMPQDTPVTNLL